MCAYVYLYICVFIGVCVCVWALDRVYGFISPCHLPSPSSISLTQTKNKYQHVTSKHYCMWEILLVLFFVCLLFCSFFSYFTWFCTIKENGLTKGLKMKPHSICVCRGSKTMLYFGHECSKAKMLLFMQGHFFPRNIWNIEYPWTEEVLRNLKTPGEWNARFTTGLIQ